jgi:cell division protein FtsB
MTKAAFSPYQEGVKKALKAMGEQHATEAIQQGVPVTHIESHAGLAAHPNSVPMPGAMYQPAPIPTETGINTGAQQPQQNQTIQPNQNPQNAGNILSQLLSFIAKPSGVDANGAYTPGTSFGGLFREPNESILAGQQALNAQPSRALALKIAEADKVPLTQSEKATAAGTGFNYQVTALNDQLSKMAEDEKSLQEQMKTYESLRGPLNKMSGGPSKEMKGIQKQIDTLRASKSQIHQRLANLYGQQPNFTPSSNAAPEAIAEAKRRGLI